MVRSFVLKTFENLLIQRFIDPEDCQNEAPSVKEIFGFMCKYPQVIAFGYAVSPKRKDYRVSIEGIYVPQEKVTLQLKEDFIKFCQNADELLTEDKLYAWWD
ncbi:MAG: hypothetical protein BWY74_03105 [Firmicutes bacterium ADurb.Bin419]|nr:MAG: hypothetical protein BWY74_03105 [Firmicutes bacterium ADurb.Bin419]